MRRTGSLVMIMVVILAVPVAAMAAPPGRPLPVTPSQYTELRQIEVQPQHVALLDIQASFKSEHEKQIEKGRLADDISSGVMLIGYPTLIVCLLIAAAPL